MKRLVPALGVLVLVGAVAVVVWQRSEPPPSKYVELQHADGSQLWRSGEPDTPLVRQVVRELATRASLSLDEFRKTGAIVVTTIDAKAQSGAATVIRETAAGQPGSLRYSITAVDPASGSVRAYSPGNDPAVDHAGGTKTKLLEGDGTPLRPFDLASAYATFAAEGVHRDAHFVTHVTDVNGTTLYQAVDTPQPAFDRDVVRSKDIANQVTRVLRDDPACDHSNPEMACRPGVWPLDGASGRNRHAWMAGYTPQLAVSVFVGGEQAVDAGLPKTAWLKFLEKLQP